MDWCVAVLFLAFMSLLLYRYAQRTWQMLVDARVVPSKKVLGPVSNQGFVLSKEMLVCIISVDAVSAHVYVIPK